MSLYSDDGGNSFAKQSFGPQAIGLSAVRRGDAIYIVRQTADAGGDEGLDLLESSDFGASYLPAVPIVQSGDAEHGIWQFDVDANDSGLVAVVFRERPGGDLYAKLRSGGIWGSTERITQGGSGDGVLGAGFEVDVSAAGKTCVTWREDVGSGNQVWIRCNASGVWGAPVNQDALLPVNPMIPFTRTDSRNPNVVDGPTVEIYTHWDDTSDVSASNCCFTTFLAGCDDPTCEAVVCGILPSCCTTWDSACSDLAEQNCAVSCDRDVVVTYTDLSGWAVADVDGLVESGTPVSPFIAVNREFDAMFLVKYYVLASGDIRVDVSQDGGLSWIRDTILSASASRLRIAFTGADDFSIAYTDDTAATDLFGEFTDVFVYRTDDGGASYTGPVQVSQGTPGSDENSIASLATQGGNLTAFFTSDQLDGNGTQLAKSVDPFASESMVDVDDGLDRPRYTFDEIDVAVFDGNAVLAATGENDPTTAIPDIFAYRFSPPDTLVARTQINTTGRHAYWPDCDVAADGFGVCVWAEYDPVDFRYEIQVSSTVDGGLSWSGPVSPADPGDVAEVALSEWDVSVLPGGTADVVFSTFGGTIQHLRTTDSGDNWAVATVGRGTSLERNPTLCRDGDFSSSPGRAGTAASSSGRSGPASPPRPAAPSATLPPSSDPTRRGCGPSSTTSAVAISARRRRPPSSSTRRAGPRGTSTSGHGKAVLSRMRFSSTTTSPRTGRPAV